MEQNDVVETIRTDLPAIADDRLIEIAEQAEKRVNAVMKIKQVALKVTNPNDWVDQNDRPYLQASGGEKIARLFGISWRIFEPEFQQLEGGHFSYTYKGEFALGSATIEAVGTRSSKDPFFKKYVYSKEEEDEEGKAKRTELPPSEIDKGDVRKSAYTNLIGNGITRLLGIRNLTYEDLATVGITKEAITRFQYKKGGKGPPPGKQEQGHEPLTDPQRKKLYAMMKEQRLDAEQMKAFNTWLLTHYPGVEKEGKTVLSKSSAMDIFKKWDDLLKEWREKAPQAVEMILCPDTEKERPKADCEICPHKSTGCPEWPEGGQK